MIYGKHFFSWRRLIAGSVSSIAAVSIVYPAIGLTLQNILGWSNAVFHVDLFRGDTPICNIFQWLSALFFESGVYSVPSFPHFLMVVWDSLGYNVVPDLVSLAETAWIVGLASRPRAKLLLLAAFDIIFTTAIWFIWIFATLWLFEGRSLGNFVAYIFKANSSGFPIHWYFALTTYFTSTLWIGFVFLTLLLGTLRRAVGWVVRLLESRSVQELPILFFTSVICLGSWLVFLVVWVLRPAA